MHASASTLAAVLALAPAAAIAADVPGNSSTKAVLPATNAEQTGNWHVIYDADWYRVQLKRGDDVGAYLDETGDAGSFTVRVRDAQGRILRSGEGTFERSAGFEFHVPKTGTYFFEARLTSYDDLPPSPYRGDYVYAIGSDCRQTIATKCVLDLGKTQQRRIAFDGDVDYYKVNLTAGRSYTVSAVDLLPGIVDFKLDVLDSKGGLVQAGDPSHTPLIKFKAASSSTYFIKVYSDIPEDYGDYQITIK